MKRKKISELPLEKQAQRHKLNSRLLYASKPVVTATPLAITMAVKGNEWFNKDWKIATGGTIAIIIMALSSLLVNKKSEDESITNTWITLILGWYVAAFIFMLMSQVMYEIWWVMMVAGSGMLASAGIDFFEKKELTESKLIKEGLADAKKELYKEKAKAEMNQPTE